MTQPCHKDTTLNQQCCDSKHKDGGEKEHNVHNETTHTNLPFSAHNTTIQRRRRQHNTKECKAREDRTMRSARSNSKTGEHHEEDRDNTRQGDNTPHTPPRHSTGPPRKRKGDTAHKTGSPATQPPFTHHATHHHNGTPPSATAPPSTNVRGEQTEDTPPHEHHRHTLTTHTPQHPAMSSARHDSSTRQHCSGMSRAQATPPHWAGQQHRTPPPFHTPRRMDTIHSSTHLLSHCSRSHT